MTTNTEAIETRGRPASPTLNMARMGLAVGATGVLFYLGCILTMATVPHDQAVTFFNSLLHGLDVAPILRASVPIGEAVLGIFSTFVLGWFAGALIALFYNWSARNSPE